MAHWITRLLVLLLSKILKYLKANLTACLPQHQGVFCDPNANYFIFDNRLEFGARPNGDQI